MFWKIICGVVGGYFLADLGFIVAMAITAPEILPIMAIGDSAIFSVALGASPILMIAFWGSWAYGLILALTAPRPAKAWRRILLAYATLSFIMFFYSLYGGPSTIESGSLGAGISEDNLLMFVFGAMGFVFGVVFLIIGLLVGRDSVVVVIKDQENRVLKQITKGVKYER
ncbi:MAG: hypothetical protein ACR2PR_07665 [Pseudohongiellaceae bacterium]